MRPAARSGPYVSVIGPGAAGEELLAAAEAVGRELARRGAAVVCGGLGGAMEAACRGARAEGGTTIGILPGTDRALDHVGAVHCRWDPKPVPVNGGRLREVVGEAHLEYVPNAGLDDRAWDLPVVAPPADEAAGGILPLGLACFEIDGNDRPAGVWLSRVIRAAVGSESVG